MALGFWAKDYLGPKEAGGGGGAYENMKVLRLVQGDNGLELYDGESKIENVSALQSLVNSIPCIAYGDFMHIYSQAITTKFVSPSVGIMGFIPFLTVTDSSITAAIFTMNGSGEIEWIDKSVNFS